MENIRNFTGRIKSCMACNEDHCPVIRERLDEHVISHHSTFRPSDSQDIEPVQKISGTFTQTRSLLSIMNSDENTSTSDLVVQKQNSFKKPNYREILEAEILEWAKDLPKYPNPSAEILKQNIINELIEKIYNMSSEINEDYYNSNLGNEINDFLDSLPVHSNTWESESALDLKEKLVNKILELNRKSNTNDVNIRNKHRKITKMKIKENITSSTQTLSDTERYKGNQNNLLKMPRNSSNDVRIHLDEFGYQNERNEKKFIDAQVQDSFSNMTPYFGTIYGQPKLKMSKQKIEIKDEIYKQIIFKWLMQVILKSNRNIEHSDKKVLTDVLFNRLRSSLTKDYISPKNKLLMKGEILNFLYDYFRDSVTSNAAYFNHLVEDITTKLLIERANTGEFYSKSHTAYLYNYIDPVKQNIEPEYYLKPIIYKIVTDNVRNIVFNSDSIENDICQLLLHNIHWIRLGYNKNVQTDLFVLLRSSTELCDQRIEDIIGSIMRHITYILYYNNINNSATKLDKPQWSNIYSIYTSQHKLRSPNEIRPFIEHNIGAVQNQDNITTEHNVTPAFYEPSTNENYELEYILKEFIARYIEYMYHVENLIARQAFSYVLQTELLELSTSIEREDTDNVFNDNNNNLKSATKNLYKELKYIDVLSDWLKVVPVHASFNRVGNRTRIEFVLSLAESLIDIEEHKVTLPAGTDFNMYLMSIINKYTEQLPILLHYRKNMTPIIHDLIMKIAGFLSLSPSCEYFNTNISSTNSTNIPNQQLSEVIERYIRKNCENLSEDELKLDALSARLAKEIQKLDCEDPVVGNHSKLCQKLSTKLLSVNKIVKRFSLELKFVEQISNWLNNMPLFSITDKNSNYVIVKMVSNLARQMSERESRISDTAQIKTDLKEFIIQWISELPIDLGKDFDLQAAMWQLINRMKRVYKENHLKKEIVLTPIHNDANDICKFPHSCCNKPKVNKQQKEDPRADIVQSIENWSANLPVLTESENVSNVIKNRVATKLYQKVSELNTNPESFTDNIIFQELLSEEIETQLQNLPQHCNLENVREDLKQDLLSLIMGKRMEMREKASGTEYKHELEKTIELSLPNPRQEYQHESPGFKIYKDRLASLFILENFDYGLDTTKESYVKTIKKEINKYYLDVQSRNAIPLTNQQFFNELYSALFNVPLPNDKYISQEVEEIKTRYEINKWFETIPLSATTGVDEILERDQILAMLSKRLHIMEKYEHNSESKMQKEIRKWLARLPLLPGKKGNVDEFVSKLLLLLKSTSETRKCTEPNINIDEYIMKERCRIKRILDTNQINGQSSNKMTKTFDQHVSTSCVIPPNSSLPRRPADLLLKIVEMWCDELPLPANTTQEINNLNNIKDNLVIKIIMKISELNLNPETFNGDLLYDILIDDELENIISSLPTSVEFLKSKNIRKTQLKNAIKTILPHLKKDRDRFQYKQELKNVVDTILLKSRNEIRNNARYIILKDDIIDNFIMYNNDNNEEVGSLLYKILIHNDVYKYFSEVMKNQNMQHNLLIIGNKLLCEMDKVPVINKAAIADEIQEIKIKFEIIEFLEGLSLSGDEEKIILNHQILSALAKRLSDLCEISCSSENRDKMKNQIMKYLHKLDYDNLNLKNVDSLIEKILNLQMPDITHQSQNLIQYTDIKGKIKNSQTPSEANNNNSQDEQWMSLLSITPKGYNNYEKEGKKELSNCHRPIQNLKTRQDADCSDRYADIDYPNFEQKIALTSSMNKDHSDQVLPATSANEQNITVLPNQKKTYNSSYLSDSPIAQNTVNSATEGQKHKGEMLKANLCPTTEDINVVSQLSNHSYTQDSCSQHPNPNETANYDQQNISAPLAPFNGLLQKLPHQNHLGQKQRMLQKISIQTSSPNDSTTQFPHPIQKQCTQNEFLRLQTIPPTFRQDPNMLSSNINQPYSFGGILNSEITSSFKDNRNSRKIDNISSISPLAPVHQISKANISVTNTKEPRPFVLPSQPSPSTSQFTPTQSPSQHIFSDSNICRSCRRPSITFFKPTDMISESNNSAGHLPQTEKRERGLDMFPLDEDDENKCICGSKRKRQCKCQPICRMHMRKHCKICSSMNPFYCSMPPYRYPGFYYY